MPAYKQRGWQSSQKGDIPLLGLTLAFSCLVFALEAILDLRQYDKFKDALASKKIPKLLQGVITQETFDKSNDYGVDKYKFGILQTMIMFVEGMMLVFQGYLPWAWDFSGFLAINAGLISNSSSNLYAEIVVTVIFIVLLTIHDTVISLPFELVKTFVIEQNHGFNKSTVALYFSDKAKGLGLTVVFAFPIIAIMVCIVRSGGPFFYFYVWAFLFLVSIVMMTIYPTVIAPMFNKYTKLDKGPVFDAIETLAKSVAFPLTNIFLVDGSKRSAHSNAYFYGFFKNKRIVLYDTLIEQVEVPELLAILGHEIGHWKLNHTQQGFIISQLYTFALFLAFSYCQNTPGLFAAFGFNYTTKTPMPVFVGLMLFSTTFWSPVDKILSLLMNFNSRYNEFAADKYAQQLGMADALGRGLVKISVENLGNMVPDEYYSLYHFSHPPLVERLAALNLTPESMNSMKDTKDKDTKIEKKKDTKKTK